MQITAVTGLYDVGRSSADGRTMDQYVEWLNKTLEVPLPFVIFLDPSFDASGIRTKAEDQIIRVAKDDLTMFKHRGAVEHAIATNEHGNRRDISYNLPDYGMLVMSKLEMVKRAASETDADWLLWIDAGLSRFLPDLKGATPVITAADVEGITIGFNITDHLAQFMSQGKLPRRIVGSCLTLVSGGDFIVARSAAKCISDRLDYLVEKEWLPDGRWDNEQVAMGCLFFRGGLPGARALTTTIGWANVTRWVFGAPIHHRKIPLYVRWRLFRDWVRTLKTPTQDCFLPGDFDRSPGC